MQKLPILLKKRFMLKLLAYDQLKMLLRKQFFKTLSKITYLLTFNIINVPPWAHEVHKNAYHDYLAYIEG